MPLREQDRALWDRDLVREGQAIVRRCLAFDRPGPYQIQAAINAVHSDGATDWSQVLTLYDQLSRFTPSPIVTLNRAVALAELEGPAVALAAIDGLDLADYHVFHAVRADFLDRLSRRAEAREAYERALELTRNEAERAFLRAKLEALADDSE